VLQHVPGVSAQLEEDLRNALEATPTPA
jgi:hypothetical protein